MSEEKRLWIRGLSQEVRDQLEQEARESHRTLSSQVVWILERHVSKRHGPTEGMSLEETEAYYNKLLGR